MCYADNFYNYMKKIYRSKAGLELVIPLVLMFVITGAVIVSTPASWSGILILVFTAAFIVHLFLTTYYVVEGNTLRIRCGFMYNSKIDISSIKQISETNNPLSSPATSLDRLEIRYAQSGEVLISPKEKHAFIKELQTLNPAIKVVMKARKQG